MPEGEIFNDVFIERTQWIILRPYINLDELINTFKSLETRRELEYELNDIFKKKIELPDIFEFKTYELHEDFSLIKVISTIQKTINTIGGNFYYNTNIFFNLIFGKQFLLIDKNFLRLLEQIDQKYKFETNLDNKYHDWNILYNYISECPKYEFGTNELKKILNNSSKYGKVYSLTIFDSKKYTRVRESIVSDRSEILRTGMLYKYPVGEIENISFRTYLLDNGKLEWTIDKNFEFRTNKTTIKGIEKFITFILDIQKNHNILYQATLREYFGEEF